MMTCQNSSILFMFTLALKAIETKEIVIFTEHFGYHIFPLGSVESINHNTNIN